MSTDYQNWSMPYEAPTSLDTERLIGAYPRRMTLWTLAGAGVTIMLGVLSMIFNNAYLVIPVGIWLMFCTFMSRPIAMRPPEYWLRTWLAFKRMPKVIDSELMAKYHSLPDIPRGVVELTVNPNLRLTDDITLGGYIKRLHAFYLALRFPIQIVIRAWVNQGHVERRWFIAVTADTDDLLHERLSDIVASLEHAGLVGEAKNGDMYDTLQECWSPRSGKLGPSKVEIERDYCIIDDEYVRGMLLSKTPRTFDANWLAAVLDGDLPVDVSIWLDARDNNEELNSLSSRLNELETAQLLNVGTLDNTGRLGYRDPDVDDDIKDAKQTRLMLRRRVLRVFITTVGFVVRGNDYRTLDQRSRLLIDHLREHVGDDPVLPIDYEQHNSPLMAVPSGYMPIAYPLRFVSPALARTYPFSNSCISLQDGVECGLSIGSKRVNRLNLFKLTNPHMVVLGTTGSGKGYWIKVFLWRLINQNTNARIHVIQTEKDEYGILANYLGDKAEIISITDPEDSQLTNPNSSKYYVVYDLTRMESGRGVAVAKLIRAIGKSASYAESPEHSYIVVDELGIVLENDEAASALSMAYRTFRSVPVRDNPQKVHRIAMIGASQRPSDLLRNAKGKVLPDMSDTHLYLRHKSTELHVTRNELHLNQNECDFLESAKNGDALLVAGNSRVGLHLYADPAEDKFART